MNEQRKKIIISEIKHWRQSKLLPAHYCDFLITLYAQGEDQSELEITGSDSVLVKERKRMNIKLIILLSLVMIVSVSVFIFNNYPAVTLGLSAVVVFFFLLYAMRGSITKSKLIPFLYILSAFMLLIMSLKLWTVFFEGETMLLITLLALNCILWLFAGKLLKLLYFTISGAAGILLIITFLFVQL